MRAGNDSIRSACIPDFYKRLHGVEKSRAASDYSEHEVLVRSLGPLIFGLSHAAYWCFWTADFDELSRAAA